MINPAYFHEASLSDIEEWPERYFVRSLGCSEYQRIESGPAYPAYCVDDTPVASMGTFAISGGLIRSDFVDTNIVDSYGISREGLFSFQDKATEVFTLAQPILDEDTFTIMEQAKIHDLLLTGSEVDGRLFLGGLMIYLNPLTRALRADIVFDANFARTETFLEGWIKEIRDQSGAFMAEPLVLAALSEDNSARLISLAALTNLVQKVPRLQQNDDDMRKALSTRTDLH